MTSTAIVPASVVAPAAWPIAGIVSTLDPADLTAPTPCDAYDVRALLNHLLFWGPVLEAAGLRNTAAPAAPDEAAVDLVVGDWSGALGAQLDRLVTAWSDPAAWDGTTSMGGPGPLPAAMVGAMVVGEFVVHGWDLGRALGRVPSFDEHVLAFTHDAVAATAAMGRDMGVYGPEVPVPAGAPTLDKILGLTGRDPHWAPRPI